MTIKLPNFRRHFQKRYPISFLYKVSNLIFWCFNLTFFKKNLNLATLKNQNVKEMNYCNTFLKVNAWMFWAAQICSELYYSVNLEIALVLQYWKCQAILWFQPKRGGLSSFTPISVSSLICTSGKEYCSQAGLTKFIDIRTTVHLAHCCVISHISVTFLLEEWYLLYMTSQVWENAILYLTGQSLLSQVLFLVLKTANWQLNYSTRKQEVA